MDKVNIYSPSDVLVLSTYVDDTSYRYKAIMGENSLNLKFSLPEFVEIEVDSYVDYKAERYFLFQEQSFTKNNTRNFEYNLTFLPYEALLQTKQFKFFMVDSFGEPILPYKVKWSFTGKPIDFLNLIVRNMNDGDSGWAVGSYIDGEQRTLSFNQVNCAEFLKQVADEYKTEYSVSGKTISLGKVEIEKESPIALSYGKGNGLRSGVRRGNGDSKRINRLYVQGGSTNIDKSKYRVVNNVGSDILMLPPNATKVYNGITYETDANGTYVQRAGLTDRILEGSYENTDIYPQRVGTVSSVVTIDAAKNLYDIVDSSIPVELNYSNYMIGGEVWTIIFQTGALAGQEFDLAKYYHVADDTHAANTFEIVPKEDAGIAMPSTTLIPAVGDKYIVFHISMPQSYIDTAETALFDKAVEVLYENEVSDFAFDTELDPLYAKTNWLSIGGKLNAGNFVSFTDPDFSTEPVLIRIQAVREFVNKPYEPVLELNNKTSSKSIASKLRDYDSDEVRIDNSKRDSISYTKRRWRDALETMGLLEAAMKNFQAGINPIWVKTMSILVGEESLQFRYVDDKTTPETVSDGYTWNNTTKIFSTPTGIIQHMTIGVKNLSSTHAAAEYLFWDIPAFTSPVMVDTAPFYIYLKCSKTTSVGEVLMSKTSYDMNPDDGYYYFLAATLGSEVKGERSLITTYGFTEITPGRITLDRIVSPDGFQYWDMLSQAFQIGDAQSYLRFMNGVLEAQQIIIKSPSGDTAFAEIYVGTYDLGRQYYAGDYFDYSDGNQYICTLKPPTAGVLPTNTTYFRKKTEKGASGDWTTYVFKSSATQPATPTGTNPMPSGWVDAPNSVGTWWMSKALVNGVTGLAGTWSTPIQVTGTTGTKGDKTVFKYAKNTSLVTAPTISTSTLNPGAAWTAIPPILSTGEYAWMTSAVVNNAGDTLVSNWTTPVRISGEKGVDGTPAITLVLSNSYQGIPTDANGNNGVYTNATTNITLYVGGVAQTTGVTLGFAASDASITYSNPSTWRLDVLSMGVDTGYITVTALYSGLTYTSQFRLAKIKAGSAGAAGSAGVSYWLNSNADVIVKKTVGSTTTYSPSTISFYPRKQVGVSEAVAAGAGTTFYMQGWNGSSWVDLSGSPFVTPALYTYTTPTINGTYSKYRGALYYGTTLLDHIEISMVEDAASAKDSLAFQIGGFASYQDYVNYVTSHGQILMQGGKINANLIDVDALVASNVLVENFANIVGTYFKNDAVTFTQQNGITFPATINGTATSLDVNPQSLPDISTFTASIALTGTTNLPSAYPNMSQLETYEVVSTTYQSIPSGVSSIKNNSFTLAGNMTIQNRDLVGYSGFVLKCSALARFYNGSTPISDSLIGNSRIDRSGDYSTYSFPFASKTIAVPNGATNVKIVAQFQLIISNNFGEEYGALAFNGISASAYFYNATGVYRSRISPDGYALARDANNFFHVKATTTNVTMRFQGDLISNSIPQKLVSCIFEANGTPRASGGYGTRSSFQMDRVTTGIYRVTHNMGTSLSLNANNYVIQATSEVGLVLCYIWPVDNNVFQIRCFNLSGAATDTVLHVTVTRI